MSSIKNINLSKRFLIILCLYVFFMVTIVTPKEVPDTFKTIMSDITVGMIFFIMYSFIGTNRAQESQKIGSFLKVYLEREKYVKLNNLSLGNITEELREFNDKLELELKILSLYITNKKIEKTLENYCKDWSGTNSETLIKKIKEETCII